jgi:uncharacterized protein YpbB
MENMKKVTFEEALEHKKKGGDIALNEGGYMVTYRRNVNISSHTVSWASIMNGEWYIIL